MRNSRRYHPQKGPRKHGPFLISFLSSLGGAPKIDLPLSMFSLANSFLTSLFSISTLLTGETKTIYIYIYI